MERDPDVALCYAKTTIVAEDGSPIEPTVLYIPVRRWSDGSPGPAPAEPQHKM